MEPSPLETTVLLLRRLKQILSAEGGQNWLPGIKSVLDVGEDALPTGDEQGAMREMGRRYRHMHSGPGGFGDFFVWRPTTIERQEANEELNRVKAELWSLLS